MAPSPALPGGCVDAGGGRPGDGTERWRRGWWRIPVLLILAGALVRAANVIGFAVAGLVPFQRVDPDGAWAEITVHHVVQLLLVLAGLGAVVSVGHRRFADFGFTWRRWRWSLKWAIVVVVAWAVIQIGVGYLLVRYGNGNTDPGYPVTGRNVVGRVTFSALSGLSEEPLYRGMAMSMLIWGWAPLLGKGRSLAVASVAGSTIVFMFDHIGVYSPTINPYLEATVLVFGIVNGVMFWRTRSLVGPVVVHGLVNVVITVVGYWLLGV